MQWTEYQYQKNIVLKYGVDLIGWPLPSHFADIGMLSMSVLNKCALALEVGDCKWVRLSADKLRKHVKEGEALQKAPRKPRCDKGKKRKRRGGGRC